MSQDKELQDWAEDRLDLALVNNEKLQARELTAKWSIERLEHIKKNKEQTGVLVTFYQGTDSWTVYGLYATFTSMAIRNMVEEQLRTYQKTEQGALDLYFWFLEPSSDSLPFLRRQSDTELKHDLPYFPKFVIHLIVSFWNTLTLPELEDIDRIANENYECTAGVLVLLFDAACHFDDDLLKDAILDALRCHVKKGDFLSKDSLMIFQGAFGYVGVPGDEYDDLRKIFLTAAAIHMDMFFLLSLREDDGMENTRRAWNELKQTPAFEEDWEMAIHWYYKCYHRS